MKTLSIDIQIATESAVPSNTDVHRWVESVLATVRDEAELSIRFVDNEESAELNERFRQKQGPTNVLSFPFEAPANIPVHLLGDIIICAPVVEKEAEEQNKPVADHWAHMLIHGTLHLLGYDHIETRDALIMEGLEVSIMLDQGMANPYENIPTLDLQQTPPTIESNQKSGRDSNNTDKKGQPPEQGQTHPLQPPSCH